MDEIEKQFGNLEVSKLNYFTREHIKYKLKHDINFQQHLKRITCSENKEYNIDYLYAQYIAFIQLLHKL
jgi:hypothetical protein